MRSPNRLLAHLALLACSIVIGIVGIMMRIMHWPSGNAVWNSALIVAGIALISFIIIFAVGKRQQS